MANIEANKKRHRQDEKKRILNHSKNSEVRTRARKIRANNDQKELPKLYAVADKAAKNKRIHRNKANRIKSRTAIALNKAN